MSATHRKDYEIIGGLVPVSVTKRIAKCRADPEQGFQLGLQGSQRPTVSADLVAGTISGRTCCWVGGGCWEDICA